MAYTGKPAIVGPDEGEAWWFLGTLATIRIAGEQTGGHYSLMELLLPKDAAPPLHSHPQDETFIVLDGSLKFWVRGTAHECAAGSVAFAPGGEPHSFLAESEAVRALVLSTPAGIERMVRMLGDPARQRRLPDDDVFPSAEKIGAVFAAVGVTVHGPPPFTPVG